MSVPDSPWPQPPKASAGDAVPVLAAADPVAAFFAADAQGQLVALPTSGTTGAPRLVVRTTDSWVRSYAHVASLTGLGSDSRLWLAGPMSSTLVLFAATLAHWAGAEVTEDPSRATHAHLTPLQLRDALDGRLPMSDLHVTVAGDRLSRQSLDRAGAAGARVAHYYGAAELSFVAWGTHDEDLRPFPEVEVEVRDGLVWVRSPYGAERVVGAGSALRVDDLGWATVGDRGRLGPDGVLRVAGRGTDAITTGGATVLAADVETALLPVCRGEVAVVGVPHERFGQLVAAVLTDADDLAVAKRAARAVLTAAQRPRLWLTVPRLPRTGAGKVDRAALAELANRDGIREEEQDG